jgi:hypothetical protein
MCACVRACMYLFMYTQGVCSYKLEISCYYKRKNVYSVGM